MKEKITSSTCLACGLCCVSLSQSSDGYCDVSHKDMKKLGESFVKKHVIHVSLFDILVSNIDGRSVSPGIIKTAWRKQRAGPLKGKSMRVCVALRGSLMYRTSCSVYDKRPAVCKTACVPGDRACRYARKEMLERIKNGKKELIREQG
jgi:Fe-S-cluster containining protein